MSTTPWYTSDKLIESVKRKIAFPISQSTFTEDDILAFANEEMYISQVPAVMQYHEEYFVYRIQTPLVTNISRYPIPDRAIGMKLRDIFWSDSSGNYFEMTRIAEDDKAFFQRNIGANQAIHKFYLENNDVILAPSVSSGPTGNLNFFIFLRPNQLVRDSKARQLKAFTLSFTLTELQHTNDVVVVSQNNLNAVPISYSLTAGVDYSIGVSVADNATNLASALSSIVPNLTTTVSGSTITLEHKDITTTVSSLPSTSVDAISVESKIGFKIDSTYEGLFESTSLLDFLQRKPGHRTYCYDVPIQDRITNGSSYYIKVNRSDLLTYYSNGYNFQPQISNIQIDDYVCLQNECIIPQIPPDLHNTLAERTAARILAALGDTEGLQTSNAKLQEIEVRQGTLLDTRVEGSVPKVISRHSLLRMGRMGPRRRL